MLKEIYLRDPSDPLYSADILEHSSELENLLGQIRMLLYTKQGDVMGSYDFGFNLEDSLFLFNLNEAELKQRLLSAINAYCIDVNKYNLEIDVQFFEGTVRDVCLIDIIVDDEKRIGILIK